MLKKSIFVIPSSNKISKYDYHNIFILFILTKLNKGLNWVKASYALLCINLILRLVTIKCWLKHLKLAFWEIIMVRRTKGDKLAITKPNS